jgi:hypothetical protein
LRSATLEKAFGGEALTISVYPGKGEIRKEWPGRMADARKARLFSGEIMTTVPTGDVSARR